MRVLTKRESRLATMKLNNNSSSHLTSSNRTHTTRKEMASTEEQLPMTREGLLMDKGSTTTREGMYLTMRLPTMSRRVSESMCLTRASTTNPNQAKKLKSSMPTTGDVHLNTTTLTRVLPTFLPMATTTTTTPPEEEMEDCHTTASRKTEVREPDSPLMATTTTERMMPIRALLRLRVLLQMKGQMLSQLCLRRRRSNSSS